MSNMEDSDSSSGEEMIVEVGEEDSDASSSEGEMGSHELETRHLFLHCFAEEWDEATLRMDALDGTELCEEATETNAQGCTCSALIARHNDPLSLLERLLKVR